MSHYFQQLLVSSGVRRPASPAAANPNPALNTPGLEEVSEERIAPPAGPGFAPISPGSQPTFNNCQPFRPSLITAFDANQTTTSKSDDSESGVVEIRQSSFAEPPPAAQTVNNSAAVAASSPALPTAGQKVTESPPPLASNQESSPTFPKQEAPATVPTSPSRDELIEHVFRWVGENQKNVIPAALSNATKSAEPLKASKQTVQPQTPPQASAETAPFQIVQPNAPAPSLPTQARQHPQPATENNTHESTVEISIGTLQIQVDAPPAASAKPLHRPAASRTPARRPVAAAQPPAIDINRLRRGFYL